MTSTFMVSAGADVENNVTVAYTSDKGLCGGINSTVTKYTRGVLRVTEGGELSKHLCSIFCTLLHRQLNVHFSLLSCLTPICQSHLCFSTALPTKCNGKEARFFHDMQRAENQTSWSWARRDELN